MGRIQGGEAETLSLQMAMPSLGVDPWSLGCSFSCHGGDQKTCAFWRLEFTSHLPALSSEGSCHLPLIRQDCQSGELLPMPAHPHLPASSWRSRGHEDPSMASRATACVLACGTPERGQTEGVWAPWMPPQPKDFPTDLLASRPLGFPLPCPSDLCLFINELP